MEQGTTPEHWGLTQSPGEIYERCLVPAVYAQWAIKMMHLAEIDAGCRVLDVGCGTGILARKATEEVGFGGQVCGLDLDSEMLTTAARMDSTVRWHQGDASALPFEEASFDHVLSQFMLPHVRNRVASVREMWRVLKPGGRLLLAVWAPLYAAPAFNALVQLIGRLAGGKAARTAAIPWELGTDGKLATILDAAGARNYSLDQQRGTARFRDIREVLEIWLRRGPPAPEISQGQYRRICAAADAELEQYRVAGGDVVCALNARIVSATKR